MTDLRKAALVAAVVATTVVTPALAQPSGNAAPTPPAPGTTTQHTELSDTIVRKVGVALHQTAAIRQKYAARAQSTTPEQQQQLAQQAETEMQKAIGDQGLTVQQDNQVIHMAQADPSLKQRLRSAAQSGG